MQPGDRAWIALGAGVAAWDAVSPPGQMLSERSLAYRRAHAILWCGLVTYIAGHLMHVWPARVDVLTRLAQALGR